MPRAPHPLSSRGFPMQSFTALADLGWSNRFLGQLSLDELDRCDPARVAEVHRDRLVALAQHGPLSLSLPPDLSAGAVAVGDWLVHDRAGRVVRLLDRASRLARRAAGDVAREQLI